MAKVFGGVGHGGSDPGAISGGFREASLALDVALEWEREMKRHGVQVALSRYRDENDTISEEIRECNAYGPELAIDFHFNSGGGDGFEAFHHFGGGRGKTLAANIEKEVVAIGQNSRGLKIRKNSQGTDYYAFIRDTNCPAIIVECAFVDNANDMKVVDTLEKRKAFGRAVAKGTLKTLGIPYQGDNGSVSPSPNPAPPSNNGSDVGNAYLKIGSQGTLVRRVQTALAFRGYLVGLKVADGIFGNATHNAVMAIQRNNGLMADGIVGPDTWRVLEIKSNERPMLQRGSKGTYVKALQLALNARNYSVGSYGADGDFGGGTVSAVTRFQSDNGLIADGIVGPATWSKLLD